MVNKRRGSEKARRTNWETIADKWDRIALDNLAIRNNFLRAPKLTVKASRNLRIPIRPSKPVSSKALRMRLTIRSARFTRTSTTDVRMTFLRAPVLKIRAAQETMKLTLRISLTKIRPRDF